MQAFFIFFKEGFQGAEIPVSKHHPVSGKEWHLRFFRLHREHGFALQNQTNNL